MVKRLLASMVILHMIILACPLMSGADTGQFYFLGMTAPKGSISSPGADQPVVYLRWDVVEGNIPDDLAYFILKRNGTQIPETPADYMFPAAGVMSETEIEALYRGAGEESDRREKEIIRRLIAKEGATVNSGNFAQYIHDLINPSDIPGRVVLPSSFWEHIGSRMDFNIARARYRGYIDTGAASGINNYELWGVSDTKQVLLGKTSVDAGTVKVMPEAKDFIQVRQGRCDTAAETYKDHGTVSLYWEFGSQNITETFLHSLLISGYDLYRTTENLDPGTEHNKDEYLIDIRLEAGNLAHDTDGLVDLSNVMTKDTGGNPKFQVNLEKVNDVPVMISNPPDERRYKDWNPEHPVQFVEMARELITQGLRPGDSRVYYLVGRDFTGNYTNTVNLIVTVPDYNAPPGPWDVRAVDFGSTFKLVWEHVSLASFYDNHRIGRQYCNLSSESETYKELCYVPENINCGEGAQTCIDLNVKEYLVYRFDDKYQAESFFDRDGDGYSNTDERSYDADNKPVIGAVCEECACEHCENTDPPKPDCLDGNPEGKPNYLIGRINADPANQININGRMIIEFEDTTPNENPDTVFWYRVASRDWNGNVSPLSGMVEGSFNELTKPTDPRPCVPPETPQDSDCVSVESSQCDSYITQFNDADPRWVVDRTRDAVKVSVDFCDSLGNGEYNCDDTEIYYDFEDIGGKWHAYLISGGDVLCNWIASRDKTIFRFYNDNNAVLASTSTDDYPYNCNILPELRCGGYHDISQFDLIDSDDLPATIVVPVAAHECAEVSSEIGNDYYSLSTSDNSFVDDNKNGMMDIDEQFGSCAGDVESHIVFTLGKDDLNVSSGANYCLLVRKMTDDDQYTRSLKAACFTATHTESPEPPSPEAIDLQGGSAVAYASWRPPAQKVIGTIIEWYLVGKTGDGLYSGGKTVIHADHTAKDGAITAEFDISPIEDLPERWCFRARSMGYSSPGSTETALSPWSGEKCGLRIPPGYEMPQYLPWPNIEEPPNTGQLDVTYKETSFNGGVFLIKMSDAITTLSQCDNGNDFNKAYELEQRTCEYNGNGSTFCSFIRSRFNDSLNFVAYRQSKDTTSGTTTDFVQVSPLIDTMYCTEAYVPGEGAVSTLNDPFIYLLSLNTGNQPVDGLRLHFADPFPYICGQEYRYQFVYFDDKGEITGYKFSDWVLADCQ